MTIRSTILLFGLPLFLLLAGLNGGLLWLQENAEQRRAQEGEAIAAAVTVAEFVRAGDSIASLSLPQRAEALRRATALVPGLESLYIVAGRNPALVIKAPTDGALVQLPSVPRAAQVLDAARQSGDRKLLTAVAPLHRGAYVVANVDAQPRSSAMSLGRFIGAMFVAALLAGLLVSILFARLVTRELAVANRLIDAVKSGKMPEPASGLRIREIRELADAVELMATNLAAALGRMQRRKAPKPDLVRSVSAYRSENMGAVARQVAGVAVAIRHVGDPSAGCFFALAERDGRGAILIGCCGGEDPADALANALRSQRFFTEAMFERSVEANIALSRQAHRLDDFRFRAWSSESRPPSVETLALAGGEVESIAAAYAAKLPILSPAELVEDLDLLLPGSDGIIAVMKPDLHAGAAEALVAIEHVG